MYKLSVLPLVATRCFARNTRNTGTDFDISSVLKGKPVYILRARTPWRWSPVGVQIIYLVLFLNHPDFSKSWFSSSASPARVQLGFFSSSALQWVEPTCLSGLSCKHHGLSHHIIYLQQWTQCICSGEHVIVSDSFTESVILEVKFVGVLDPGQVIQTYLFTSDLWSCVAMVPLLENIGVWLPV